MKVTMQFNSEKKHSVRYDEISSNGALSTIYIMKPHLPTPYPKEVVVTLEFK